MNGWYPVASQPLRLSTRILAVSMAAHARIPRYAPEAPRPVATSGRGSPAPWLGCHCRRPTGAGKTYVFELLHESRSLEGQAVYTVPTRALANDKFAEWKDKGWDVGIATGDLSDNIHAPVLVATLRRNWSAYCVVKAPRVWSSTNTR